VSRNTILVVYDRLRAEGFVEARTGSGTYVSEHVRSRSGPVPVDSPLRPRPEWAEIHKNLDLAETTRAFDLRPGIPDASYFPFPAWRARISRQFWPEAVGNAAHIGAAGHPDLRGAIAHHLGVSRGVRVTPGDVFVTNGSQQALNLLASVLLAPGDTIAVEEPGYTLPRRAFQALGLRVAGVPVDEEGLMVEALPHDARVVYVTPSHQYPLGMAMSMGRRQELLAWARQTGAAVIEDDYDSEFRFGGRPLEPLHALDGGSRVLYVGSFSKVMLPTLRLGFVVIPPTLRDALEKAKGLADWHTCLPLQAAAAQFVEDGLLAQHIRRMRRIYEERHNRVMEILARDFEGVLHPLPSMCGLHLTALLEEGIDRSDTAVAERARSENVSILPLSHHYLGVPDRRGLLLGYGAISLDRVDEALRRLRRCV
jgi:GntR family transcriptional regulator/MocR family aminotransferase